MVEPQYKPGWEDIDELIAIRDGDITDFDRGFCSKAGHLYSHEGTTTPILACPSNAPTERKSHA